MVQVYDSKSAYTIDDLPDWRLEEITYHDKDKNKAIDLESKQKIVWEYRKEIRIRPISSLTHLPSKYYLNIAPKTWITDIMNAAREITNGDISITNISTSYSSGKILVTMKLPLTLESTQNDTYGITLIAMNSYKQNSSQKLGAGAIRFACLNGCIFGDHSLETWNHRNNRISLQDKVKDTITQAAPIAKQYIEKMKSISFTNTFLKNPDKLDVQRQILNMNDQITIIIMNTSDLFTWNYKELICQYCYNIPTDKITKYDLWNAFTNIITHHMSDRVKYPEIKKDEMLREVNTYFEEGNMIDNANSLSQEKIERLQQKIMQKYDDKFIKLGPQKSKKRK